MNSDEKLYRNIFYVIISFSVFLLLFAFLYPRIGLSYHGNFHQTIVYQILNGRIPPEQPCLAGVPINYPWTIHVGWAVIQKFTGINFIKSFQFLNFISYLGFIFFIYKANSMIFKRKDKKYLSTLLSLFGLNLLAIIFYFVRFPNIENLVIGQPDELLQHTSLIGDSRYAYFFPKFLSVSGYPLGLVGVGIYFYKLINIIKTGNSGFFTYISLVLAALFTLLIHPFSGTFVFVVLFPAFVIANFLKKNISTDHIYLIILHFLVGFVVLPYLISISGNSETINIILRKLEPLMLLQAYPLHVFLFILITFKLFQKKAINLDGFSMLELFFILSSTILVILVTIITFQGANYKFVQLLSLLISPLLALRISEIISNKYLLKIYLILSILIIAKFSIYAHAFFGSNWASEEFVMDNKYTKIGRLSSPNDIIVQPNDNFYDMRGGYVSQQRIYAADCIFYTSNSSVYENRKEIMNNLSSQSITFIKDEFPDSIIVILSEQEINNMEKYLLSEFDEYVYIIGQ